MRVSSYPLLPEYVKNRYFTNASDLLEKRNGSSGIEGASPIVSIASERRVWHSGREDLRIRVIRRAESG